MKEAETDLILLKKFYCKFDKCEDIDNKLEMYFQAVRMAWFELQYCSGIAGRIDEIEKVMGIYYGRLLFYLYFLDIGKLNLTIIDNHVNELTPDIKEAVLKSDAIFQLMHFKIDSIIKQDRHDQNVQQNIDSAGKRADQDGF